MLQNSYIHIPNVGYVTEKKIWNSGVKSWNSFNKINLPPSRKKHIKKFVNLSIECLSKGNHSFFSSLMPNHLHLIATLPKGMTNEKAFQLLKGCSAYTFFKNHTKARLRYPQGHLWSRGGTAVTVGYNQISDTVKYILEQAKHHGIAC